jgi:hypothetical protein
MHNYNESSMDSPTQMVWDDYGQMHPLLGQQRDIICRGPVQHVYLPRCRSQGTKLAVETHDLVSGRTQPHVFSSASS